LCQTQELQVSKFVQKVFIYWHNNTKSFSRSGC